MKTAKFATGMVLVALAMIFASCSRDETDPSHAATGDNPLILNDCEKCGLAVLLETAKMHRDIYTWINARFPHDEFTELAESEGTCRQLLTEKAERYGLTNPTLNKLPGEFENPGLQNQYNEFIRLSTGGLQDMIDNAIVMEEAMICKVVEQQCNLCGKDDIRQVYGDLLETTNSQLRMLKDGF